MGVIGYKRVNLDMTCKGFKYEVGKIYTMPKEDIKICEKGFHFCKKDNTLYFYSDPTNSILLKVEALGKVIDSDGGLKSVTNKIKILEVIYNPTEHSKDSNYNTGDYNSGNRNSGNYNSGDFNSGDSNSGHHNSGYYNSGDFNSGNFNSGHYNSGSFNSGNYNSGYYNNGDYNSGRYNNGDHNSGNYNSGHYNSGDWNSGDWNSGNWNSGHYNSGMFNTTEPKMRMFNKDTDYTISEFYEKFSIPDLLNFNLIKGKDYKESFKIWFDNYDEEQKKKDIEVIKKLPNFDADIFEEIFGVRI